MYGNSRISDYWDKPHLLLLLINAGADVNAVNKDNLRTMLQEACDTKGGRLSYLYPRLKLVEALLNAGADAEYADYYGNTALNIVSLDYCRHGSGPEHEDRVEILHEISTLLVGAGSDPLKLDEYKHSPLYLALLYGKYETAMMFIKSLVDKTASERDAMKVATRALRGYINLAYDEDDHYGSPSPLRNAVRNSDVRMIELILALGADIDALDNRGRTALFYCRTGRIATLLLDKGAYVNHPDYEGNNALQENADMSPEDHHSGYVDVAKVLIERGIDVNNKNIKSQRAIDIAQGNSWVDLVTLLKK